jgi:hypothetical protein
VALLIPENMQKFGDGTEANLNVSIAYVYGSIKNRENQV